MTRLRPGRTASRTQAGRSSSSIPRRLTVAGTALAGVGLVVLALSKLAGSSATTATASVVAPTWPWVIPSPPAGVCRPNWGPAPDPPPERMPAVLGNSVPYRRALGLHSVMPAVRCTTRDLRRFRVRGFPPSCPHSGHPPRWSPWGSAKRPRLLDHRRELCGGHALAVPPGWDGAADRTTRPVESTNWPWPSSRSGPRWPRRSRRSGAMPPTPGSSSSAIRTCCPPAARDAPASVSAHDLEYLRGVETRLDATLAGEASAAHTPMSTWPPPVHLIAPAPLGLVGRSDPGLVRQLPPAPQCRGMAGMAEVLERAIGSVGPN